MPLCQCCEAFPVDLSVPYGSFIIHLCQACYGKMKSLIEARNRPVQVQYEIEQLQYWWSLGEAAVPAGKG